jgi:protein-disulfide isomerase
MNEDTSNGPIEQHSIDTPPKPVKEKWLTMPIAIVMAGAIIGMAILVTKTPANIDAAAVPAGTANADAVRPPSTKDHIIGDPNAPVVIVEYADFQCPYCSVIYPTLKRIVAESGGAVAWVFRNFPLESIHPEARPSAMAAECINDQLGNDAYWKFMEDAFENQQSLGSAWYVTEAGQLGADLTQFNACVTGRQFDARIDMDTAEAIQSGGNGTPFTIVLGKDGSAIPFSGALPYSQIKALVNSILGKQSPSAE